PTLRQRDCHAVHAGDRIEQCSNRMLNVLVNIARPADVLHQVNAVWLQRLMNTFQDVERLCLIVNSIKCCDEVEGFGRCSLVEITQIDRDEVDVVAPASRRFVACVRNRVLREIHPHESAPGIECCERVQNVPPTTSYVKHADALCETIGQTGYQGKDVRFKR